MSGNPDNTSLWGDADVYVAPLGTPIPTDVDEPFGPGWDVVGLLDGEAGFEESRSQESSDFFAWGGILFRTSIRNFVLTRKFVAFEENATTLGLVWPGSGQGERRVPKRKRWLIAFETWDGDKKKRVITALAAEVSEVGTIKDGETEPTKLEITVKIFPTASGLLFHVQPDVAAPTVTQLAIAPSPLALPEGQYQPLVVTATFSDGSTRDVTAAAVITSSDADVLTVDRGYAHGVADGEAIATARYRDFTATSTVVVA